MLLVSVRLGLFASSFSILSSHSAEKDPREGAEAEVTSDGAENSTGDENDQARAEEGDQARAEEGGRARRAPNVTRVGGFTERNKLTEKEKALKKLFAEGSPSRIGKMSCMKVYSKDGRASPTYELYLTNDISTEQYDKRAIDFPFKAVDAVFLKKKKMWLTAGVVVNAVKLNPPLQAIVATGFTSGGKHACTLARLSAEGKLIVKRNVLLTEIEPFQLPGVEAVSVRFWESPTLPDFSAILKERARIVSELTGKNTEVETEIGVIDDGSERI
jgi:hypothetical protein